MIYVIQGRPGTPLKIGYSGSATGVHGRLRTLQTGYPYELRIIATAEGSTAEEKRIHKALATQRLRGEWFEACPAVDLFLERLNFHGLEDAISTTEKADSPYREWGDREHVISEAGIPPVFRVRQTLIPDSRQDGTSPPVVEVRAKSKVHRYYLFNDVKQWLIQRQHPHTINWAIANNFCKPITWIEKRKKTLGDAKLEYC